MVLNAFFCIMALVGLGLLSITKSGSRLEAMAFIAYVVGMVGFAITQK